MRSPPGIFAAASAALILLAPAVAARARAGSLPSGYFVDSTQAAAHRPAWEEEKEGDYTYSIRRGWPDSTGERLLGVAEALYPRRDIPVRVAAEHGYELGDTAHVPLWWCKGIGASRVPYAVTAGALDHYLDMTQLYRDHRFREAGTLPLFWSELVYRGTIAERDTFRLGSVTYRDVYVATLTLFWSYDDGTFLPSVEAHRLVVLAPDGTPLAVDGDGSAEEKVVMSTRRGIGREERIIR